MESHLQQNKEEENPSCSKEEEEAMSCTEEEVEEEEVAHQGGKEQYCDVLVLLFCGTSGIDDSELLGSDESDLIIVAWQLIDLKLNETGDIHYVYVKPNTKLSDEHESEDDNEGNHQQRVPDEFLRDAPPFSEAIKQFEQTLRYELNDKKRTCSFTLCTDGECHVRQVLMPAAVRNDVHLPDFFYSFFNLKKEFRKYVEQKGDTERSEEEKEIGSEEDSESTEVDTSVITVEQMLENLNVEIDDLGTFGVDQVRKMSSIVQVLLSKQHDHVFSVPERIVGCFETKPGCGIVEPVADETVVRARGLPWQASDHDVARFFKGLNIAKGGVALVLNNQGRRNGEALVRFTSPHERNLALLRHKHHMGSRYIEVYRASGEEFLKVAAGTSSEAADFLNLKGDGIVRIRGLPFTATSLDIIQFFGEEIPVAHAEEGVLLVRYNDGKYTGDAFVLFETEETAAKALTRHKETLGTRYVEIFKSTAAEVQQVLSRYNVCGNPTSPTTSHPFHHHHHHHIMSKPIYQQVLNFGAQTLPISAAPAPQGIPLHPHHHQTHHQIPGALRNYIRLRGMPYVAKASDITQFLGTLACDVVPNQIHFVVNAQGRPSGDAFVQMKSVEAASRACQDVSKGGCHKKHMGTRYVEVFQCSYDDMQVVMMGGTLNRNGTIPPPGMIVSSEQRIPLHHHQQQPTAATTLTTQPAQQLQFLPATAPQPTTAALAQPQPQYFFTPQGGLYVVQPNTAIATTGTALTGGGNQQVELVPAPRFLTYPTQLVHNLPVQTTLLHHPHQTIHQTTAPVHHTTTEVVKFSPDTYQPATINAASTIY